jgi:phospholipid transport system substrate-binding protein
MRKVFVCLSLLGLLWALAPAHAEGEAGPGAATDVLAPDVLVKSVSDDVLGIVRSDKDLQAGNNAKLSVLVQDKIIPHFDFGRMAALSVGLAWRKASPEQRAQLTHEFQALLVRTYSSGLAAYRNQVVEYKPLRMNPSDTEVVVRSEIRQSGAQPVTIDYRMEKLPRGWKVFDVAIGGVSLVTTYRDSFSQEVRDNGIDALIRQLAEKNQQLAQGQSASPGK